jgi:hypothetical protein
MSNRAANQQRSLAAFLVDRQANGPRDWRADGTRHLVCTDAPGLAGSTLWTHLLIERRDGSIVLKILD